MQENSANCYRLSPQQEYLWALQQIDQSQAYGVRCAVRIEGCLDVKILRSALETVISRHEILRTTFQLWPGTSTLLQTINGNGSLALDQHDLTGSSSQDQLNRVAELFNKPSCVLPDHGPLLFFSLIAVSATEHVLIIKLPALCGDATTLKNLVGEINRCYQARSRSEELSEEVLQYVDVAEWQNQLLESDEGTIGREYWRRLTFSSHLQVQLPYENVSAVATTFSPRSLAAPIPSETLGQIDSSTADVLLACWQVLLWRLTGEAEITIGTTIEEREYAELKTVLGPVAQYLPLHARLEANLTFSEVLEQVRKTRRTLVKRQEYFTWDDVRNSSGDTRHTPFPAVSFGFEEHDWSYRNDAVSFSVCRQYTCLGRFKVRLLGVRKGTSLSARFYFDPDLFEAAAIKRLSNQFLNLLKSACDRPDTAIAVLDILDAEERHRLLFEFNETRSDYPHEKCFHELFAEQVRRTPQNIAAIFGPEQLTYEELHARANKLARYLRKLGAKPETLIGICMERSLKMLVGILGILEAGAAYVPLDPTYPKERLALMFGDARPAILLTQTRLLADLPEHDAKTTCLDRDWDAIVSESEQDFDSNATPENLAYVIYTSGSTGKPKGVMITQRGLVNYLNWCTGVYPSALGHGAPVHSSIGFDLTITSLFAPLLIGQKVVLLSEDDSIETLSCALTESNFDFLKLTPSHLEMLSRLLPAAAARRVETLIIGGEALLAESLSFWRTQAPQIRIINEYGPTEAVVGCCVYEVADLPASGPIPIGRPIANTQLYVLDSRLQPVPEGMTGELFIGGTGLARGYLNQPDRTAEGFVPHPFSNEPGARLYRTGDMVRQLPSGELEFSGRSDKQVKVRGYRIELGEIEIVLKQHPSVNDSVIIVREDVAGDRRIIAYITSPSSKDSLTTTQLHNFLAAKLPDYMIPSSFVILRQFPLTPHGKIDLRALPRPEQSRPEIETKYVAPRTAIESLLAENYARLLGLEQVGIHDGFFELGGHSLLATQLISRVRNILQVELSVRQLFDSPAVAGLAEKVETALRAGADLHSPPPIRVTRDVVNLPLSYGQQRLWFLDRLDAHNPAYNMPAAVRLTGTLDLAVLQRSLNEIIRRHEALRTTFVEIDGEPVQLVAADLKLTPRVIELGHLPDRESEALRLATEEAHRPFDLGTGPLLRVTLLRLDEDEHIVLWTIHHIVCDGWSMEIFVREFATLYEAYSKGQDSPLTELPIQYGDYAVWQREWLRGEVLEQQLAYWKQQLAGELPVLELPADRARPAIQTFRGAIHSFDLTPALSDSLKHLTQKAEVTLFMTLLAAFQALLHRYTSGNDILVGTPIAGRTRSELEGLIGFFVNTLVLRMELSDDPNFLELLARCREVALGAYAHQDLPFEQLVDELQPQRDLSRNPLFQVFFVMQNVPLAQLQLTGLKLSPLAVDNQTTRFDLALRIVETPIGLKGVFEYSTDLFERESIERLARYFENLLNSLTADPSRPISRLSLLSESERRQLPGERNQTQQSWEGTSCLHEWFEAQATRTPTATAVVYENEQISYQELNQRANQLAHYLRTRGVREEMLVGIFMERSIEMMIGLLAVLKTGAAYVPLDPVYPRERLRLIIEDAQPELVVQHGNSGEWLAAAGVQTLNVEREAEEISRESIEQLTSQVTGENLAYVIYTSGSTGRPKGVMISHDAVVNFLHSMSRQPGCTAAEVLLAVTTLSFDIAVLELLLPLVNGAQVVLVSRDTVSDGRRLRDKLEQCGATMMQATPATWRLLLAAGWTGNRQLKILCGGEALSGDLANELRQRGAELWNVYGPTETTIWSALYKVEQPATSAGSVSIGRPLANTELYVLDASMQVLPGGVAGELYIGGAGLARGYWRDSPQTAARFVPHPFSDKPGARLYRTGDRAHYLSDGNVRYLGRADQQVKIRGFRIELGEIEAALSLRADIHESAVVLHEDARGEKRIVGYVVTEAELSVSELRDYLKERLPEYMIPSVLMKIDKLPLTPNGKVDRRALPAPELARPDPDEMFIGPGTAVEEIIAGLWMQVLGVQKVGINDNFFALGGHSLLVTQVMARVLTVFGVDLPVRALFEAPMVSAFARSIEEAQNQGLRVAMPPLRRVDRDGRAPLTFAQQRLWFLNQLEPESTAYLLSVALKINGRLNLPALEVSINQLIKRHETLRTTFRVVDGEPVQLIAAELQLKLLVEDLSRLSDTERTAEALKLAGEEAQRRFDLSIGPLLRVRLLRLSDEEHVLLLTMHHIISDAWSMALAVRELAMLYNANNHQQATDLAELKIQYGDYAAWQREWLSGEELDRQLTFWEQQLATANYVLELPADRPRPALQSHHGAGYTRFLNAELTRKLMELSARAGSTLFMTLLAAFRTLIYRYTNQFDILIGVPIANRNHTEIESLIGYFANTLVLRADVSEQMTFSALLARVREAALNAYAHQDVPFEKVVERLRPARDLSRNPLFQVFFNLQNLAVPTVALGELTLSSLDVETTSTRFDLALGIFPSESALRLGFEYSTELFESETIERMAAHFSRLLEDVVEDPERRLSEFSLLSEGERDQLISGWNSPRTDGPRGCVHELFEAQVVRAPGAVALCFEQQALTYGELNRRANQLAHYLRARGVKPEATVAVCLERSLDLIISLLAVIKAGGAYVPLDPAYPPERLRLILENARTVAVITDEAVAKRLRETGGIGSSDVIRLSREWKTISQESEEQVASGVSDQNLAYVIYTSGSTGRPKGVQVTHQNLVSLLQAGGTFPFDQHDVWSVFHSFTFDLSVWEIFAPLVRGSRLVLVPLRVAQSPALLFDLLRTEHVTILHQTPSLARHLLGFTRAAAVDVKRDLKLRLLVCGGEALPGELSAQLLEWDIRIWNFYGPTEATVWATTHVVDENDAKETNSRIGRPLSNTEVFILDDEQRLLPPGVIGELCIGGGGVARAYLGAPSETALKFVPHPFSNQPGERLYRTGDLAQYLPDGQIRYVGRVDQQVKFRGYRIQLGEIEAMLIEHPSVNECVVVVRDESDNQKRLVCYVTEEAGAQFKLSYDEMRQFLEQRLPEYMVPTALVKVERIPLTRSGKVDRRALPALEAVDLSSTQPYVEPRNLDEALLAGIWANVLGRERVGINDNFFALGGHSLLSPGIISKVKEIFHTELPLRILFEAPTVAALAKRIKRQARIETATPYWSPVVAIQSAGSKRPLFCVHPGGGGVSCYRDLSRLLGMDQPFYGLQAAEVGDGEAGEYQYQSLEATAADYVKAVREAQPDGPYLLGGWSAGGVIAFEMAQELKRQGQAVALLALFDAMPRSVGTGKVDDGALAFLVAREIAANSGKSLPVSFEGLQKLEAEAQVGYLLEQLKLANVLPQEMELSSFARILKGIRTRNEHLERYEPRVYPGRITLFRGSEIDSDFIKAQNALDWNEIDAFDPTNGWSRLSTEPIEVHEVPGHHYTIVRTPNVEVLARKLGACLDRAGQAV